MAAVDGGVLHGDVLPRQCVEGCEKLLLVAADGEDVVPVAAVQVAGVSALGVQLVGGHDGAG